LGMADDVFSIGRKLDSIIKAKDFNEDNVTDLLKALQSLPMSLEMLQKTRVGLSVNTIRKRTENPELASLTKSLIKSWKKLVPVPSTKPKENQKSEEKVAPVKDTEPALALSPSPKEEETLPEGAEDLQDPVRNKCRDLLYNAMKKRRVEETEVKVNVYQVASEIEKCIFQEMRGTNMKYKNRIRSRVSNLGDEKNPDFIALVLSGGVAAEMIAKMAPEEMASQKMREKRNEYQKEAIRDAQIAVTGGTKTNLLTCGRCKKSDVLYNQLQTRSADEPMTTFCVCEHCGHRWKFC